MYNKETGFSDCKLSFRKKVGKFTINCFVFAGSRFETVGSTRTFAIKLFNKLHNDKTNVNGLCIKNF